MLLLPLLMSVLLTVGLMVAGAANKNAVGGRVRVLGVVVVVVIVGSQRRSKPSRVAVGGVRRYRHHVLTQDPPPPPRVSWGGGWHSVHSSLSREGKTRAVVTMTITTTRTTRRRLTAVNRRMGAAVTAVAVG